MKRTIARIMLLVGLGLGVPAEADELESQARGLLADIASMSHGHYAASVWRDRAEQVQQLTATARREGKINLALELQLVRAMIMAQVEQRPAEALGLLEALHRDFAAAAPDLRRRVYVARAEVLSLLGREGAIAELIAEFKVGPLFDPEDFTYKVEEGRDTPLRIPRPQARGSDSITVTAMEKFRRSARHAAGEPAPPLQGRDLADRPIDLRDYRGRVVLIDFWNAGWVAWQRDLPALKTLHREFNPRGFEIIGVPLGGAPAQTAAYVQAEGMGWTQLQDGRAAARSYSVFGEASNFLVNQDGIIVGRNLRGSDLRLAVQRLLAREL